MKKQTRGGRRLPVYDEYGILIKKGAGRIKKEETISTGFRVHKESLEAIREANINISQEVNRFIKRLARKISKK
jgi:hypothetical protein